MEIVTSPKDLAKELGPAADAPVGTCMGVASIALNMAMKYHDIMTVQDGALYQQYKLEGKNLRPLHLDMVFETAIQIERHLVASNKRIMDAMIALLADATEAADADEKAHAAPPMEGGGTAA